MSLVQSGMFICIFRLDFYVKHGILLLYNMDYLLSEDSI